jgi:exopolysaccharide biosynthesis glucuronosyltransferase PssE
LILVTVGNATQRFERLVGAIDALLEGGAFGGEPVVLQYGSCGRRRAPYARQCEVLAPKEYGELMANASVVICHAGAGSLYHAFSAGKVPVVMPRRRTYGEHLDDQLSLARELQRARRACVAYEPEDLLPAIEEARLLSRSGGSRAAGTMLMAVSRVLDSIVLSNGGTREAKKLMQNGL